jgi:hypothetical protein
MGIWGKGNILGATNTGIRGKFFLIPALRDDPRDFVVSLDCWIDPFGDLSVGLQGSCILILDPDRFDLTVGGRRRLFSWTRTTLQLLLDIITYSRLPFSCRLPFKVYH